MRIILMLLVAGFVGSTTISVFTAFMTGGSGNYVEDVGQKYQRDPQRVVLLTQDASIACVPRLTDVRSEDARLLFSRSVLMEMQSSPAFGSEESREKMKARIRTEMRTLVQKASKADIAILDEVISVSQERKVEMVGCIFRHIASS